MKGRSSLQAVIGVLVILGAATACCVGLVLGFGSHPERIVPPRPQTGRGATAPVERSHAGAEPTATSAAPARDAHIEAASALAGAAGLGWIHCELPTPSETLDTHLHRFRYSRFEGTRLIALVESEAGRVHLTQRRPTAAQIRVSADEFFEAIRRPRVDLSWGDAWAGEEGWCTATPPQRIPLDGVVVDPHGSPTSVDGMGRPLVITGCGTEPTTVGADGSFTIQVWQGPKCLLSYAPFTSIVIVPEEVPSPIVLTYDPQLDKLKVAPDLLELPDTFRAVAAEIDASLGMADPFEVASSRPGVSQAARDLLDEWQLDDEENQLRSRDNLRRAALDLERELEKFE